MSAGTATDAKGAKARLPSALRFRVFWAGQSVSFIGSEVTTFAIPMGALLILKASPFEMGLLTAAGLLPNGLAPFFAGPMADRLSRRPLMLATDLGRMSLLGAVPALWAAHLLSVGLLLAFAFAIGLLSVLFDVAYFAYLPDLVRPEDLQRANGHMEASRSFAVLAGPSGAGILVRVISAPLALLVDAASFLVSVLTLAAVKGTGETIEVADRKGYWLTIKEGFSAIFQRPPLILLGLGSGGFNFFDGAALAMITVFALHTLRLSTAVFGIALALGGVGGVAGGVCAERVRRWFGNRGTFLVGLAVAAVGLAIFAAGPPNATWGAAAMAAGQFAITFGSTLYVVTNASVRQELIEPGLRGRVYATMRLLNRAVAPLGALLGGLIATITSPRADLLMAACGEFCVFVVFFRFRLLLPGKAAGRLTASGAPR